MSLSQPALSLCMIVKDEEFFLRRCLQAVCDHVDEIVIVDTGSTDQTRAIAADFTDRIFDFKWVDDFARARNYALEQASGDWILVLDADELLEKADAESLRRIIRDTDQDAFFLQQYNYSNNPLEPDWIPVEQPSDYSLDYRGYRKNPIARLFRNREDIRYHGRIHEVIDLSLESLPYTVTDIPIHHHANSDPSKPREARGLNYLRMMDEELREHPDGRLFVAAASTYMYSLEDYPKAIEYYQRALDLDYEPDRCREGIAEGHYRLEELQEAYRLYLVLYQSGYRTFTLCNNLANLMVKSGQYSRAAQLLDQSLSLAELPPETEERIRHNIRYLRDKAGTPPRAEELP